MISLVSVYAGFSVGIPLSRCYIKITAAECSTLFVVKASEKNGRRKRWPISLMKTFTQFNQTPSPFFLLAFVVPRLYPPPCSLYIIQANFSFCPPSNTVSLKRPDARDFRTKIPSQLSV